MRRHEEVARHGRLLLGGDDDLQTARSGGLRGGAAVGARGGAGAVVGGPAVDGLKPAEVEVVALSAREGVERYLERAVPGARGAKALHLAGARLLPAIEVDPRRIQLDLVRIARRPRDGRGDDADRAGGEVRVRDGGPLVVGGAAGEDRFFVSVAETSRYEAT